MKSKFMIWKYETNISSIEQFCKNTLVENLGIEIIEILSNSILSKMPVDQRTKQPMGLLHGGASAALSESVGSIASFLTIDSSKYSAVGIDLNAKHLKSVNSGYVYGKTTPKKLGKTIHIWETEINDEKGDLICISSLTVFIRQIKSL